MRKLIFQAKNNIQRFTNGKIKVKREKKNGTSKMIWGVRQKKRTVDGKVMCQVFELSFGLFICVEYDWNDYFPDFVCFPSVNQLQQLRKQRIYRILYIVHYIICI